MNLKIAHIHWAAATASRREGVVQRQREAGDYRTGVVYDKKVPGATVGLDGLSSEVTGPRCIDLKPRVDRAQIERLGAAVSRGAVGAAKRSPTAASRIVGEPNYIAAKGRKCEAEECCQQYPNEALNAILHYLSPPTLLHRDLLVRQGQFTAKPTFIKTYNSCNRSRALAIVGQTIHSQEDGDQVAGPSLRGF